jgi:hypothetical protein
MSDTTPAVPVLPPFLATRSSNVHGIALRDGVLFVKFSSGSVYSYTGEPAAQHYSGLLNAPSSGQYFAAHVRKDPRLVTARIEFCAACGAGIPPKPGEGTCQHCNPGVADNPAERAALGPAMQDQHAGLNGCDPLPREQHENGDGC